MEEMVKAAGSQTENGMLQKTDEEMIQNLRDAAGREAVIAAFLDDLHAGRQTQGISRLRTYRQQLLEDMHTGQKRIDCLDYLLYSLKKGSL